jgi:AraC-like DNA-binding protein
MFMQDLLDQALLNSPPLFSTQDLEEARRCVARVFKPHDLRINAARQQLHTRMYHARLGNMSLNRLAYGAEVNIDPGRLGDFVLVQMPLQGQGEVQCGKQRILTENRLASVLSPTQPLQMRWSADCDQLMLRIERSSLERCCAAYLGHALDAPLQFELGMAWQDKLPWFQLMHYLVQAVQPANALSDIGAAHLEHLVINQLLRSQPHNYSDAIDNQPGKLAPRHVKLVEDYLHAHAQEFITPQQLAGYAGISLRSLYASFREYRNTSPMEYLRDIRLERCRRDLQSAMQNDSVTSIALRWGFQHLGRFSVEYRQRYGETPRQTLRRLQ